MTKLIFDELTGTPSILATNRAKRHNEYEKVSSITNACAFCKGNEALATPAVYQDQDAWSVRVFPNKYPLVTDHDIIVHSPEHTKDIEDLPHEDVVKIIRAYLNRLAFFTSQDKEVFIFNNRGGKAGASITHPHSQIVALKGFPGIIEHEKEHALKYFNSHASCYWCDYLHEELNTGSRVVGESSHFVLLVPEACRWSYEMVLIPKEHKPNFGYVNEVEINDFADILGKALRAYNVLFDKPDRNFWIHTVRYEPYHWHVGFIPHIKVIGGLELGAGIWVSDKASSEDAAGELKAVLK